jgi:hypothetical protein
MKIKRKLVNLIIVFQLTILIFNSCCLGVKSENLGNNFVYSEYDAFDRRVLYTKDKCSGMGIEIVPMRVIGYAFDSKWIIAESTNSQSTESQFWIIEKYLFPDYDDEKIKNAIDQNMFGPMDKVSFKREIRNRGILLSLKTLI